MRRGSEWTRRGTVARKADRQGLDPAFIKLAVILMTGALWVIFDTTIVNVDGSTTETISDTAASGVQTGKVVTTTSADGLTKTSQIYNNADTAVDETQTSTETLNADGSTKAVQEDLNSNNSARDQTVTNISADGLPSRRRVRATTSG